MAESSIRASLPNLPFSKSKENSPIITANITCSSSPLLASVAMGSATYPHLLEGSFCGNNERLASPQPPAKKTCLDPQHQQKSEEQTQDFNGYSHQGEQILPRSSNSIDIGTEGSHSIQSQPPQQQQDPLLSQDLPQHPLLPLWGSMLSDSACHRICMFPKHCTSMSDHCCTATITPSTSATTKATDGGSEPLGANALVAAAAMAMSPLFQHPPEKSLAPESTTIPWNAMLAAAAMAFASGRYPPLGLPSKFQGDANESQEKYGGSSSRSGSPMHFSSAGSFVEDVEVMPGASQTGHHWTFQEQFKQLYELSSDPKRKEFLDDLFNFMQKRGSSMNRIPIMAKQVLDLYELYHLVVTRGGLVEVINKKLWREITKGLQLPSSITSAAFTLRTQYMKYLYPYECEKLSLSTPNELQAAIDGNRREARRSSYVFEYPMLMGPSTSVEALSRTVEQPLPSSPLGISFSHLPPPHHSLRTPHSPVPISTTYRPSLLPPGVLLPPGFPTLNSERNGSIFSEAAFFGFPNLVAPTSTGVVPLPAAFDSKSYSNDNQLMKQESKCPHRCLSLSSTTMVINSTSSTSRPNSKSNDMSSVTLETESSCEAKRQPKPLKFSTISKCASSCDLDQQPSPHETLSPHPPVSVEASDEGQLSAPMQFSEFLKKRLAPTNSEASTNFNFPNNDSLQKLESAEKKNALNGSAEPFRQAKSKPTTKENGEFTGPSLQLVPNLRISTQAGNQLGLPENTLVVCMEVTGAVYQGVLFGQVKPLS